MYFTKPFVAFALLGAAAAQSSSSTAAAAAASGSTVPTHVIMVGGTNGSLTYSPDNVVANVGDLVQFQFMPKNHSVVQSTFAQPCTPMQNVMPNATNAFFSGFMPTNASAAAVGNLLTYTIRVMDKTPIWFYCSQAKHCQSGMVGAINAATSGNKTVAAFRQLAASAAENLSPGGSASSGSTGSAASSAASSASGAAATGGAGSTATSSSGAAVQTTSGASGLVVGSVLGYVLAAVAAFALL